MPTEHRELYNSPNGEIDGLSVAIPLRGTCLSGTKPISRRASNRTDIDIGEFLSSGQRNPEHQALSRSERWSKTGPSPRGAKSIPPERR
jgi:hypothetical protein